MSANLQGNNGELATAPGFGRLVGSTAIIAGGGSRGPGVGNGRATAVVLGREGAHVIVVDISEAAAQETATLILSEGGSAEVVVADATVGDQCDQVEQAARECGRDVNILVNNIGITGPPHTVVDIAERDWDYLLGVNLKPIVMLSARIIPHMPAGGAIVNVSSIAGIRASEHAAYAAANAAVIGLTITMAGQHGGSNIRVNSVCPGPVWTPLATGGITDATQLAELRNNRRQGTLLKTEGTGWDVAYAVLFLVSRESRWITGQTLVVDGGMTSICRAAGTTAGGLQRAATMSEAL